MRKIDAERAQGPAESPGVDDGEISSPPHAREVHVAGSDDLRGGTPIGLADCDSIGKGAPSLDHRPRLAGREKFGGESANSMGDASSCGVALAGKAGAGMAE